MTFFELEFPVLVISFFLFTSMLSLSGLLPTRRPLGRGVGSQIVVDNGLTTTYGAGRLGNHLDETWLRALDFGWWLATLAREQGWEARKPQLEPIGREPKTGLRWRRHRY